MLPKLTGRPGQLLAVAWSDNVVRLVNADSSKVVQQIDTLAGPEGRVSCLGWAVNFTSSREARARIAASGHDLDDLLRHAPAGNDAGQVPDLPRDLARLDIQGTLPKLSILPSGGRE